MKYKYLVICIGIFFLAGCIGILTTSKADFNVQTDMVKYNGICKEIESELKETVLTQEEFADNKNKEKRTQKSANEIKKLEHKYHAEIVLTDDEVYMEKFLNATKQKKIIFELYADNKIIGKVFFSDELKNLENAKKRFEERLFLFLVTIVVAMGVFLLVFYVNFVYPFRKLKKFSSFLAKGEFDIPLEMPKQNYFGAFTESFDIMREELRKARQGEYEANISKKELVAGLSHDIKTPVATIEALCEILEIQVKEDTIKDKIQTIHKKAQVIDHLITDMFHATLEELQMLKTEPKEEYSTELMPMFQEINHYGKISFQGELKQCLVYMDKLRMNQVIDNIINNSYKYANTNIVVTFSETSETQVKMEAISEERMEENQVKVQEGICICIRDFGQGVKEEEMSFLTEKFYRGDNSSGKNGSGLGLYLSEKFMKDMGGEMLYYNDGGFVVELFLRKV